MKIAFIGLPCSGKTTTAIEVSKRLKGIFVPETARIVIEAMKRPPTKDDQEFIMKTQSVLENSMFGDYIVCDIPLFVNNLYYRLYFGRDETEKELYEIAKKHKYDLIFYLSPLEYKNDGVRYQTKEELEKINEMFVDYEKTFGKPIYIGTKNLNERVERVISEVRKRERVSGVSIYPQNREISKKAG